MKSELLLLDLCVLWVTPLLTAAGTLRAPGSTQKSPGQSPELGVVTPGPGMDIQDGP